MGIARSVYAGLLGVAFALPAKAQEHRPYTEPRTSATAMIASNALMHGLVGCVGSSRRSSSCADGFWKGALGGTLAGSGKWLAGEHTDYALPGRLVHTIGTCITRQATYREPFSCGTTIGPYRIEVHKGERYSVSALFMPEVAIDLFLSARTGTFDPGMSLRTLTPVFIADGFDERSQGSTFTKVIRIASHHRASQDNWISTACEWRGSSMQCLNTFDQADVDQTLRHELLHTMQYEELGVRAGIDRSFDGVRRWGREHGLYLDNVIGLLVRADYHSLAYPDRPTEIEAFSLSRQLNSVRPLVLEGHPSRFLK